MINELMGGFLENIPCNGHLQDEAGAQPSHKIFVEPETILYHAIQNKEVEVNSFHSQAITQVGKGLKITSYSNDKLIESIEGNASHYILGLQFHPEFILDSEKMRNIYRSFIKEAEKFKVSGSEHG
ncbi:gamma-glutamyl-gamma-aminobutyrate hydrolase family protein [Virgibacillus sp. YIM 98842]|uniref:gamma-glutamyl-gamma-aminobutyrate hydrolase family protein n=1 Tax=Virgibacillus sp. YIM 98842 TaxID=2663533 RepID=UPI0013D950EA|nr:gamma-glutamyl-gamma-aminobutyrate hydrolase family protein [Virgibacillus sp. YIM 98842]